MPTYGEHAPLLIKNFIAAKALNTEGQPENYQANVIVMLGHCMSLMAAGCHRRSWPDLFELLEKTSTGPEIADAVREMHYVVGRFLKEIDRRPDPNEEVDTTIFQALDNANWKDIPVEGRTAWLAMLGLYHLSRVWVVGRQWHALGSYPGVAFDTVAQSAGLLLRTYDQGISIEEDATAALTAAVHYAKRSGQSADEIMATVKEAIRTTKTSSPVDSIAMRNIDGGHNE